MTIASLIEFMLGSLRYEYVGQKVLSVKCKGTYCKILGKIPGINYELTYS